MDKEKIKAAKDRAQLVVDGFAKVRDQQARDVINLSDYALHQERKIRILENKVSELMSKESSSGDDFMNDFLGSFSKYKK